MRILLLSIGFIFAPVLEAASDPVEGFWWTEDREGVVEIRQSDAGPVGRIVWLLEAVHPEGHEKAGQSVLDEENPEADLRSRPVLGLRILEGFEQHREGDWRGGEIYDPENGRTYRARMRIAGAGEQLNLRGYVGTPMLGRTARWERYQEENLPEGSIHGDMPDNEDNDKATQ